MYKPNKIKQVTYGACTTDNICTTVFSRRYTVLLLWILFSSPLFAQTESYPRRFLIGGGVQTLGVSAPLEKKSDRETTLGIGYSVEFGVLSKNKRNILTSAPRFATITFKTPVWIVTNQGELQGTYHYKTSLLSIPLNYRRVFGIGNRSGIEIGGGFAWNTYAKSMELQTFTADTLFHTSTQTTPFTNHFSFHLLADYVYHFRWKSAVSIGLCAGLSAGNDEKYPVRTTPFNYATFGLNTRYLF